VIIETADFESPIGAVALWVHAGRLCALGFREHWPLLAKRVRRRFPHAELQRRRDPAGFVAQLRSYFAGDLAAIEAVPVDLDGTTFQLEVWSELRKIPAGSAISYAELARAIGAPRAVRAVGRANGTNPAAIVVPCHRVIGSDGSLTGYGGGIERKRWLLAHEGALERTAIAHRPAASDAQGNLFR